MGFQHLFRSCISIPLPKVVRSPYTPTPFKCGACWWEVMVEKQLCSFVPQLHALVKDGMSINQISCSVNEPSSLTSGMVLGCLCCRAEPQELARERTRNEPGFPSSRKGGGLGWHSAPMALISHH